MGSDGKQRRQLVKVGGLSDVSFIMSPTTVKLDFQCGRGSVGRGTHHKFVTSHRPFK